MDLTTLFSAGLAKVLAGVSVLLLVAVIGVTFLAKHEHTRAVAAETAFHDYKITVVQAQQDAVHVATQLKVERETRDTQRKGTADVALKSDLAHNDKLGDRYADTHSVQAYCTARGGSQRTDLPEASPAAPVDNGPGDTSQLVVVAHPDFDTCTINSTRLKNAHDWGLTQ